MAEQPSLYSLPLRSRVFIGRASVGVTAHWLRKCKHKPHDAEVGVPIKCVMCQKNWIEIVKTVKY